MALTRTHLARFATTAVCAGTFAVPLAIAAPAGAATPQLTLSASDNLAGGQHITVSASGFTANATVAIVECSSPAPDVSNPSADCDVAHATVAQAAADGSIASTTVTLRSGAIGTNGNFCPAKVVTGSCFLIASNITDTSQAVEATLTFAPVITITPSTKVNSGQQVSVSGYGFPASSTAYVTECANPPGALTCNGASNVQPVTDANGTFNKARVTVVTGTWGGKSCTAGGACLITATTDLTGSLPDQSTAAVFTFAASQTTTKAATSIFPSATVRHGKVKVAGAIEAAGAGIPGLKLTLLERAKGSTHWHRVATTKSSKQGVFAFTGLRHFNHAEQYRVTHPLQKLLNTLYKASAGRTLTVR